MRKRVFLGFLLVLLAAAPVGASAEQHKPGDPAVATSDGCLVVKQGQGTITVQGKGGIFGRFDQGRVEITDLAPKDTSVPKVFGAEDVVQLNKNKIRYVGSDVRFRFTGGGSFSVTVTAIGVDMSAIGSGTASLDGSLFASPGTYSVDSASFCAKNFVSLPDKALTFKLGSG